MSTHHVETKLTEDGKLTLNDLPFHAGDVVEVIVMARPTKTCATGAATYPLRGKPIEYIDPTEPVADEEWEALR
ncbi:MAG TPA: hypothetical protein VI837_03750 [Blastocatellia bacterium]|nr:hypothetical protein [Blastocatellia bacterium]